MAPHGESMSEALINKPYQNKEYQSQIDYEGEPVTPEDKLDAVDDKELPKEELTYKKRYGDLRRYHSQKEQELRDEIEALKKKAEATPAWAPSKSDEELEAFRAQNPEAVDLIQSLSHQTNKETMDELKALREEQAKNASKLAREQAKSYVIAAHSDYEEIINDDAFHAWAESKPKYLVDKIYDPDNIDGEFTADIISRYKLEAGSKKTSVSEDFKKAASQIVGGGSKVDVSTGKNEKIWTSSEIQNMSLTEYEKHEDEISRAQREGRIDITR